MRTLLRTTLIVLVAITAAIGQTETINNASIIELTRAGLPTDIIIKKIGSSRSTFDISTIGLVELKKAGVEDSVIAFMMEREEVAPSKAVSSAPGGAIRVSDPNTSLSFSESGPPASPETNTVALAKTIAFVKSSLHPSRQALEKELMKRKEFQQSRLSILRYKEQADLFVEIGYVSGSWVTHRYVYRIYDRRSGAVIGAGETTSWGSLAENLARNIAKTLTNARIGKTT